MVAFGSKQVLELTNREHCFCGAPPFSESKLQFPCDFETLSELVCNDIFVQTVKDSEMNKRAFYSKGFSFKGIVIFFVYQSWHSFLLSQAGVLVPACL